MAEKWFKNKKYGYGWTPATKEGWIVLAVFFVVIAITGFVCAVITDSEMTFTILFCILVLIETFILLIVARVKGEEAEFRWGDKKEITKK
ncbi:MAG: hypothetical protein ABIM99_00310 [Candidatus Dojkabacteria bacterium]